MKNWGAYVIARFFPLLLITTLFLVSNTGKGLCGQDKAGFFSPSAGNDTETVYSNQNQVELFVLENDSFFLYSKKIKSCPTLDTTEGTLELPRDKTRFLYTPPHGIQSTVVFSFEYTVEFFGGFFGRKQGEAKGTVTITVVPSASSGPGVVIGDLDHWPIWPRETSDINTQEPSTMTPIGMDYLPWVAFHVPENSLHLWGEDLTVLISNQEEDVQPVSPDFENTSWGYTPPSAYVLDFLPFVQETIRGHFQSEAVLPQLQSNWMYIDDDGNSTANQIFPFSDKWKSFQEEATNKNGKTLADSGHAWPVIVQHRDPWSSLMNDYQVPSGWVNPRLFLPTNDGTLNIFEIDGTTVRRQHQLVPGAAFPFSIYQQHLQEYLGLYPRITLLDGPIQVKDIQDGLNSDWTRVLIGTTGLGVDLQNKPREAWESELEEEKLEKTHPLEDRFDPPAFEEGHHFGIYALDITDPTTPRQLWTRENTHWKRNGSSGTSEPPIPLERCVSRPVIGYTLNDPDGNDVPHNRIWHALFIGLDNDNNLCWLDLDPMTGEINTTINENGTGIICEGDLERENLYPSRILAAYPKKAATADNEKDKVPVLSDVYVLLSNGELYFWDVQTTNRPRLLVSFVRPAVNNWWGDFWEIDAECPPIANFDIAYTEEKDGTIHTFFAAPLDTSYGLFEDHGTLVVLDLETLIGTNFREGSTPVEVFMGQNAWHDGSYNTLVQLGVRQQHSKTLTSTKAIGIPLRTSRITGESASDPVFIENRLYYATYSSERNRTVLYGIELSLLESELTRDCGNVIDRIIDILDGETTTDLTANEDYVLIDSSEKPHVLVDSTGTLLVTESDGTVVHREEVLDMQVAQITSGDVAPEDQMQVIYWRAN